MFSGGGSGIGGETIGEVAPLPSTVRSSLEDAKKRIEVLEQTIEDVSHDPMSPFLNTGFAPSDTYAIHSELGGEATYHVNGQNTPLRGNALMESFEAIEEATAVSLRLGRTVRLFHNPTARDQDFLQSAQDLTWRFPQPQLNGTTRQVAGMMKYHASRGERISIVGHSQGNLIIRNAAMTLVALGKGNWVRTKLRWVAAGNPLSYQEIARIGVPVQVTLLNNGRDPINLLGKPAATRVDGVDSERGINRTEHNFVRRYCHQIHEADLWPGRRLAFGERPTSMSDTEFAVYAKYVFGSRKPGDAQPDRPLKPWPTTPDVMNSAGQSHSSTLNPYVPSEAGKTIMTAIEVLEDERRRRKP